MGNAQVIQQAAEYNSLTDKPGGLTPWYVIEAERIKAEEESRKDWERAQEQARSAAEAEENRKRTCG